MDSVIYPKKRKGKGGRDLILRCSKGLRNLDAHKYNIGTEVLKFTQHTLDTFK
jgi:hypothetical protein